MTDAVQMKDLYHRQHAEWLGRLDFVQDQIKIFEKELALVVHQHADRMPLIEHVEEYRNILARKSHHVDEFRDQISLWERLISPDAPEPETANTQEHDLLEQGINQFLADFEDLKIALRRFVSRND